VGCRRGHASNDGTRSPNRGGGLDWLSGEFRLAYQWQMQDTAGCAVQLPETLFNFECQGLVGLNTIDF